MPTTITTRDALLTAGCAALDRGAWDAARDHLTRLLARDAELAEGWEALAWAQWWRGDGDATIYARERAYRCFRADGRRAQAALAATWLASDHLDFRGEHALAAGWLARARKLLADVPPGVQHGWMALAEADLIVHSTGDLARAGALAREAAQLGRDHASADIEAVGTALEGVTLVTAGAVAPGLRLLDEAAAIAMDEDFDLAVAPVWTFCLLVSTCERLGDLPRATQWCKAMRRLEERWDGRHVLGACRSAYGSVLTTTGQWRAAEAELLAARGDFERARPGLAFTGQVRLGELRVRQGRVADARALFEEALPHPLARVGLGGLDLAAGDARAAAAAADRVLRDVHDEHLLPRVAALELLVAARVAEGDGPRAHRALAALEDAAATLGTPFLRGRAALAAAGVELGVGEPDAARRAAEDAVDRFDACAAPYDAARARLALAAALRALGRPEAAEAEAACAREALTRLGVAAAPAPPAEPRGELTDRELEVLRLVAAGCSDAEIAQRLVLSPHTVHRHVANVRSKLRQPSRAAAVAHAARVGLLSARVAWPVPAMARDGRSGRRRWRAATVP